MTTRLTLTVLFFVAMTIIAIHQSEAATITRSGTKTCKDRHIWIADGSAPCSALERETYWALHIDPDKWCNRYYGLTDCCETCGRLRAKGIIN